MHKTHIFLILALIFLTGCETGASTPPKPNTGNIKLIGQIAASNQVITKSDKLDFARGLEVNSHFAYIAIPICIDDTDDALRYSCNENWLRVIDMTDASKPVELGYYNTPAGVWSVAVDDKTPGLFYVANYNGGIYALKWASISQ